jgi:hypothetical protein
MEAPLVLEPQAPEPQPPEPQPPQVAPRSALATFFTSFPFVLFVTTRVAYLGVSWMGLTAVPRLFYEEHARQLALAPYPAIDGLCRWDCGWFHNIVVGGYGTFDNAKIFPLLPALGAGVEWLTGINHLVVFIVVANLSALGSYAVLYRLFTELEGELAARWALCLFAAFPFAYYQAAGYPESLLIFSTALAVALARKNKHLLAALAITVGLAARHLTILGGVALVVAQVRQRGLHPKKLLLSPALLSLLLPWLFLAGFSLYLNARLGDPFAWLNSRQVGWNDWIWYGARQVLLYVPYADRPEYFFYLLFALPVVAGGVGLAWALKQRRPGYLEVAAYGLVSLVVVLSTGAAGMGRYLASVWPCFLPLGVWLSKRPLLQGPAVGFFWLFQGLFFFLFSHQWRVL